MALFYDCNDPVVRAGALASAAHCVTSGQLVVLPTDTVYGIGADAFDADAVVDLLKAKGRGRDMPVPVLIGSWATLEGQVTSVTERTRALVEAFWPGGLTLVVQHAPTLNWDLGDARGHPPQPDLHRTIPSPRRPSSHTASKSATAGPAKAGGPPRKHRSPPRRLVDRPERAALRSLTCNLPARDLACGGRSMPSTTRSMPGGRSTSSPSRPTPACIGKGSRRTSASFRTGAARDRAADRHRAVR